MTWGEVCPDNIQKFVHAHPNSQTQHTHTHTQTCTTSLHTPIHLIVPKFSQCRSRASSNYHHLKGLPPCVSLDWECLSSLVTHFMFVCLLLMHFLFAKKIGWYLWQLACLCRSLPSWFSGRYVFFKVYEWSWPRSTTWVIKKRKLFFAFKSVLDVCLFSFFFSSTSF